MNLSDFYFFANYINLLEKIKVFCSLGTIFCFIHLGSSGSKRSGLKLDVSKQPYITFWCANNFV